MSSRKQPTNMQSKSKIIQEEEYDEEHKQSGKEKNSDIENGGLIQPLINQSGFESLEQDNVSNQKYSLPSYQQDTNRNQQTNNSEKLLQRDHQQIERKPFQRRRQNKESVVCFNKRQTYLKNMKIYNALYNFTPPNQRLKTQRERKPWYQQLSEKIPVFEPSNKYLLLWEFSIFLLTCIIFYIIPIELFFQINLIPTHSYGIVLRSFLFLIFILDLLIYLNLGFFEKGKLIVSRRQIFKHYLKNLLGGKSLTDLIGLIGLILNLFQSDSGNGIDVSSYFSLLFYIRILNLNEFDTVIIQQLQLHRKSKAAYQLLRLGIIVLFISNFFACIFYRVGAIEQEAIDISWFSNIKITPTTSIYYLYALYWSVTTMISVGYGDVTPVAPYEVLVCIISMMCSCILFAYSINSIWFIISEVSQGTKRYEQSMNAINRFMRDKSIDKKLRKKINAYLDFVWQDSKSREKDKENQIIQSLPQNLKLELIYEANSFFFQKFEWSKHFSYGFLQLLAQYIKEKKYLEDDILYHQQEIEQDSYFYYVEQGEFYNNGYGIPIQAVKPGNFIGLYEFFSGEKRHESARCLELTNVYAISRKDFLDVVKNFPQDYQMFIHLKDEMVIQKNYKLFGLKCFLCDKEDHLSHQCVEVQLKKDKMRKNQQILYPELVQSESDDEDKNFIRADRVSENNLNNIQFSNRKSYSQTFNLKQEDQQLEEQGEQQKYYDLNLRLKYDVQYLKRSTHVQEQVNNKTQKYQSIKQNQVVQSSLFASSGYVNKSQKQILNSRASDASIKPNYSEYHSNKIDNQLATEEIEYIICQDDMRKTEENLRRSRRHSSLVDVAHRNYETTQKFIKSQAEIPEYALKVSKSQQLNSVNSQPEDLKKKKKNLFNFIRSGKEEKVNLNQLGLEREQKRQQEKLQKEKIISEQEKKIAQTRQNIAIQRRINTQQNQMQQQQQQQISSLLSSTHNLKDTSLLASNHTPTSNILLDQLPTSPKRNRKSSKQLYEQDLQNISNTVSIEERDSIQPQRQSLTKNYESKQELRGLIASIVQKMNTEGNIISEQTLEYTESILSKKNENENDDDIDVPPAENNNDINYVFYKYCRLNNI